MSIDKSLRLKGSLSRQRNVLTRSERIAELIRNSKFDPESGDPIGLPKVRIVVAKRKAKKKEKKDDDKK